MLTKISKLNLSYLTKSGRHALSPNEKILGHIYFFVAFCNNGDWQLYPWIVICSFDLHHTKIENLYSTELHCLWAQYQPITRRQILDWSK